MGILETLNDAKNATAGTSTRRTAGNPDQPKAQVWMNVGYEKNGKFISIPLGLPVDTMEPVDAKGQNEEWLKQQLARNALLKAIQEKGDELEPGQEIKLNMLEIRIRRINDDKEISSEENEFLPDDIIL